jgi:hypothetical protein
MPSREAVSDKKHSLFAIFHNNGPRRKKAYIITKLQNFQRHSSALIACILKEIK